MQTETESITNIVEQWAKAVREENLEGILAHHSDDIRMFDVPGPTQSRGRAAYRETWEGFFGWLQHSGVFDVSELEVTASGEVAFCHGLIHCAGGEENGERVEYVVRLTIGLQKIDGSWTITHEHHSVPSE